MSEKKYSFGQASKMKALEPGQQATLKFLDQPKTVETEWGNKFSFPIDLLSHPSYDSIPKNGIFMSWESKSTVAKHLYAWIYDEENNIRTFDFDLDKEVYRKWKLTRHETGGYGIEQL